MNYNLLPGIYFIRYKAWRESIGDPENKYTTRDDVTIIRVYNGENEWWWGYNGQSAAYLISGKPSWWDFVVDFIQEND